MRRVTLQRPFTGGMVTDFPPHEIGPTNSTFAQDLYSPQGVAIQRKGWAYDGTTADVADNLVGVWRAQFALADVTRTLTGDDDGDLFIHNPSSSGTAIFSGSVVYLPRAVYRDELMFCAQDGVTPMRRYSGVSSVPSLSDNDGSMATGESVITALTLSAAATPGSYLQVENFGGVLPWSNLSWRILESTTTTITPEDIYASAGALGVVNCSVELTAVCFPCVSVYSAGTITVNASTVTGAGTKWVDSLGISSSSGGGDAVLILVSGSAGNPAEFAVNTDTTPSNTSITAALQNQATPSQYHILRPCPFKDVAAHKESLWGTGVSQYPNRVYVSQPGWNPSLPPGLVPPMDMVAAPTSTNANDFLLDFIDVPSPYDGDHNVAILPSPNHLWVLKREKAYGIFGSFGGLEVSRDPIGPGCIDIRSAIAVAEGSFWAGEDDVYWAPGQSAEPLMVGKIAREWRALTRDFDYGTSDYCSMGVASGHLIVHITTNGGQTQRTYLCDLRDRSWQSRISNVTPRYMFTSRVPGEKEKLFAVANDRQGRVLDLAPMLDGSGTADDDAGSAPRLQANTPKIGADGIEGVTRWVDLAVHANVYDAGAAGTTSLEVSAVSEGGIGNPASATKTLTAIESDTADNLNRHHRRIARDGRQHQVQLAVDATGTDTTATTVAIDQIDVFLRDGRPRSR